MQQLTPVDFTLVSLNQSVSIDMVAPTRSHRDLLNVILPIADVAESDVILVANVL